MMPFSLFATRLAGRMTALLLGLCCLLMAALPLPARADGEAGDKATGTPLLIGNRIIHVFRAPMGAFSAAERAEGARRRIEQALEQDGEGWTSIQSTPQGIAVQLDGKPLFYVLPGDARELAAETPEGLANQASRMLQKVWTEAREQRDPKLNLEATARVLLAVCLLILALAVLTWGKRWIHRRLARVIQRGLAAASGQRLGSRMVRLVPAAASRLSALAAWLLGLLAVFLFLTYSLGQFVITRPAGENLSRALSQSLLQAVHGATEALPGMFVASVIFLVAWGASRVATEFFAHVETLETGSGMLNAHTAPATRRIVNLCLWLFALAMAYPYLPGAHTEAFKGVSVMLGLMVSLGASGIVGQVISGVMLVYTKALLVGEYVRIQDCEGTVIELGTFVTRLRTGLGEEIALPNSLILANVTRNFSRVEQGRGFVLDTTVTIGYDAPWRQVHALLLEAAAQIPEILTTREPYVVQTALSDFYVAYKLVVYVDSADTNRRARVASDLHAAIQDAFNRHGVQIMSPHYFADPQAPKTVPPAQWYAAPARGPEGG